MLSLLLAAVLSEPLVVCQTQFYPAREQDRGYLGRYPDQPLLVVPDLPPAAREIKPTRKRALWGDYTSMADIDFMYAQGRDYGLDGFAFFPVLHRSDLWNAQFTTIPDMKLLPIISFNTALGANKGLDREIEQLARSLENSRQVKVNGKTLILSYWCDRANTPEQLKAKLDAARAKVGDRFAYMAAVSWDKGLFEYRRTGKMTEAMANRLAEHWRGYLRVSDGILLDGTMSNHAITNSTRVFCDGWHREVCRLARQVADEPEFRDRKLLGFTLSLGHQNAYHQSFTANAMGTRTLRQSFANVIGAKPDVILIPEWDELNESTSWKPTLYNGYTTKRLFRYYDALFRGRPQTVMAGDDTSVPNLQISYRRLCSPGEWLSFEVLNVPDGARDGTVEVSLELTDEKGEILAELPAKTLAEGRLDEACWDVRSEDLAPRTRAVGVRLKWRKSLFSRGTVEEGLAPIDLAPADSWCLKDVKQSLRDLAPVSDASFARESDGRLTVAITCDEEIQHAMLVGNGWVQYIHHPDDAVSRFRETDESAVFALNAFWPLTDDTRLKEFSFSVRGVPEAEWLCVDACTTGEVFRTDLLSASCNPVYLRVPKTRLKGLHLMADFGVHGGGTLDLEAADRLGAVAAGAPGGVAFTAARFALQARYPKPLRKKHAAFSVKPDADRASMHYHLQLVTVSGKTWRSKPIVVEQPGAPVRTRVWSATQQRAVDCTLPAARVPRLSYDFSPEAGDVVRVKSGERHFFGLLGAPQSLVTLWNRGGTASGPMDFSPLVKDRNSTADLRPRRERLPDGRWALRFDGVDDYVAFPHETVPQWSGSVAIFEYNQEPAGAQRTESLFASRSAGRNGLFDLVIDKGEPIVRCTSVDVLETLVTTEIRSGVKTAPDAWHTVFVHNDAEKLTLTVDGRSVSKPLPMPGIFMNTAILGGAPKSGTSFFTGLVRTLDVNHAVGAGEVTETTDLADSVWLSAADAPVVVWTNGNSHAMRRAADGTSWFVCRQTNDAAVVLARWTTTALGVYEIWVNGKPVGAEILKPGFTHVRKTRRSFTYDITPYLNKAAGATNDFAAEVGAGWWRDKIVTFAGRKSAFRGVIELTFSDGTVRRLGTNVRDWRSGTAGPVTHAAIFDGEEYDARLPPPAFDDVVLKEPEVNGEFAGEILPSAGAEVYLRHDLTMKRGPFRLAPDQTNVVDFGQNCAAVPEFRFRAKRGTVLTALPAEMLNDAEKGVRGCDGPAGTVYRANLRCPNDGMRVVYTFAGDGWETYRPRFTYFGYRYLALSATDDVEIESVSSVPVSSVTRDMELGTLETGDATLNRFIRNVYWGMLSNYLSVPTDCPQRNERLGWTADTQVFAEAGSFLADTSAFLRKWMRDMRDSQHEDGSFPSVAPFAQYGNEGHRVGWADAGVIVPYVMWRQFGDTAILRENYAAMKRFLAMQDATQYRTVTLASGEPDDQYGDWLSFERYVRARPDSWRKGRDGRRHLTHETVHYWDFLAGCHWLRNTRLMQEMATALGHPEDAAAYATMEKRALAYVRWTFVDPADGLLLKEFRDQQGSALFALSLGILEPAAARQTLAQLVRNIRDYGTRLKTGFLSTAILLDTLTACGETALAYDLLLQHDCPGWLYSVDQGATTVWERWNSYTKKDGFGPVGMNSFNHYAYGSVLAWLYRTAAGIAADPKAPGFKNILMAPQPDRRLGFVKADYRSRQGLVRSTWRYEGSRWIWEFTIPEGATATVTAPDDAPRSYGPGTHRIEKEL